MIHIYNKKRFNFKLWWKYRKFLKKLKRVSPSFGMLWQMADFIKLLEKVYMYDNSPENELYSSRKYDFGYNGFIISEKAYKVVVKLESDKQKISIEITRNNGTKMINSYICIDEKWKNEINTDDELLIENVINIITSKFSDLLQKYYNARPV